jgi:hypothetical protein
MAEQSLIKTFMKSAGSALLLLCLFSFMLSAQHRGAKFVDADESVDKAAVRKDIVRFEEALNEGISATSKNPFSVINRAKGAYLPGYGLNFSFLIDIHRAMMPMQIGGEGRGRQATPEQKKQWIEGLKERIIRLIQDNGSGFQQLRREDCVTIVAFIDDRSFLEPRANKTIVLRVLKKDLDDLAKIKDDIKQRIKIFEY